MIPPAAAHWAYASLALGSALALFMYPHSVTGVLSTGSRKVIRRNAALLPAYSFLLGLLALLGFVAIAAGVKVENAQQAVPQLFEKEFPSWFAGVAFAAIGIGRWCPRRSCRSRPPTCGPATSTRPTSTATRPRSRRPPRARCMSLVVKFGALVFVLRLPMEFAINLQLLGGVWILQTFPAIVIGLYTRWFHRWALLVGWAVGMAYGTWLAYGVAVPGDPGSHFGGPLVLFPGTETKVYIGVIAILVNLVISVVLTLVLRAIERGQRRRPDQPRGLRRRHRRRGRGPALHPEQPAHA